MPILFWKLIKKNSYDKEGGLVTNGLNKVHPQ